MSDDTKNICGHKHTKYQPTTEEMKCPKCKAPCGDFCIDDSPSFDCDLMHEEDNLVCYGVEGRGCPAEYYTSGKKFAANLQKQKDLVPCEHCKGSGLVKKGKS